MKQNRRFLKHKTKLKIEFPQLSNAQISKKLGENWKKLDPDVKKIYRERAERIKERFNLENPDFVYNRKRLENSEEISGKSKASAIEILEEKLHNPKRRRIEQDIKQEDCFEPAFGSDCDSDYSIPMENYGGENYVDNFFEDFSEPASCLDTFLPSSPLEGFSSDSEGNAFIEDENLFLGDNCTFEGAQQPSFYNQDQLEWPFNIFPCYCL
eukprot:TRINITY_DN161_c0_g1_i2.p1 TRINITY_DN161_c0_g1~~TRINITY_DN161_c0_g1_i2.p1  ORF type:complete len:211 (+),score=47.91 TRINITY_DN161_c0_g1_i2:288-920(+)